MEKAIAKALEELDSLGEAAIRKQILGLDGEEAAPEMMAGEGEKPEVSVEVESEGGEGLSPDIIEKLKEALAK